MTPINYSGQIGMAALRGTKKAFAAAAPMAAPSLRDKHGRLRQRFSELAISPLPKSNMCMINDAKASGIPSQDELEAFFVNNTAFAQIEAYLDRFNPIQVMGMARMEIRHSAILAWLLDPQESHGLDDHFLKAFLCEALRGNSNLGTPTALDVTQADLRDAEIRREWMNMDIFILSTSNQWAFVIENKFDSRQHEGQLAGYISKVKSVFEQDLGTLAVRGIFLALHDEEPHDSSYAPIRYEAIVDILPRLIATKVNSVQAEVGVFLHHYIDTLKDATGMSDERNDMERLARDLYRNHRRVLDFVVEHGARSDFALAAESLFGDVAKHTNGSVVVAGQSISRSDISKNYVSFVPDSWYAALGGGSYSWPGCEKWWMGLPLIAWLECYGSPDSSAGSVKLVMEVGPLSSHEFRRELIQQLQNEAETQDLTRIKFQKSAADEGKKYSRFLAKNSVSLRDMQNVDEIEEAMRKLMERFKPEFEMVAQVLPRFRDSGVPFTN